MSSLSNVSDHSAIVPNIGTLIPTPDAKVIVLRRQIGRGSFSNCWLGELKMINAAPNDTESLVVVKAITAGEKHLQSWQRE